jgi:hypothetical protein
MFPRTRITRSRGRLAFLLAVVAALATAGAAVATHVDSMMPTVNYHPSCIDGSPGDPFCQTDNADLTIFRQSSLTSTGKSNIAAMLNREYAPTDLAVIYASTPSYSGGAETDIIYQQGTVPGTDTGLTWCNDAVSSTKCDQHYNRFDSASPGQGIACHETGHAVGLTHGQQAYPQLSNEDSSLACMKKSASTSDLGTHNTNMINATYPN